MMLRRMSHSLATSSSNCTPTVTQRSVSRAASVLPRLERGRQHPASRRRQHRCWQTSERRRWPSLHVAAESDTQGFSEQVADEQEEEQDTAEGEEEEQDTAEGEEEEEEPEYSEEELRQRLQDQGFSEEEIETMFKYQGQIFSELGEEGALEQEQQDGVRGPGCTPWQFVALSEQQVKHEITVHVEAPLDYCYSVWAERLNYTEWFDLIAEMALPDEDEENELQGSVAAFWCLYKWGMLPTLELYFVTQRTDMGIGEGKGIIVEESVEGLPLVAAAIFREPGDERGGTLVTLKIAYQLPENLEEFVGMVGVWGDMNEILIDNMGSYKNFVEQVDPADLVEARKADRETLREGNREFWETYRKEAAEVAAMAEAQGEGEEPVPTEAQLIARRRAQEVREEEQIKAEDVAEALDAEQKRAANRASTRGRGRGRGRPKNVVDGDSSND